jgi:hypothetical protein
MATFRAELRDVLSTFTIFSPSSFTWRGHCYRTGDDAAGRLVSADSDATLNAKATERLADVLYASLHCRLSADSWVTSLYHDRAGTREFVAQLSHENRGRGPWQGGWTVSRVLADGTVRADRYGLTFEIPPAEVRGGPGEIREGDQVFVRIPREQRFFLPGFYQALGDADNTMRVATTTRVYWHVRADGASQLVRVLTQALNEIQAQFWFKLLSVPDKYARCDAAVLYLPRSEYHAAEPTIAAVYREVRQHLRESVSLFALRLAPGLALAEDPGGDRSFGQHRSDMLARILANGFPDKSRDVTGSVCDAIARLGFNPDALHLGLGSDAVYRPLVDRDT